MENMCDSYLRDRDVGRTNTCDQDAKAGGRETSPRRTADVSRVRKEPNPEPWVREMGYEGEARPVTLEQDGRRWDVLAVTRPQIKETWVGVLLIS